MQTSEGADARLPCHFCNSRNGPNGLIWRRRLLVVNDTREVDLDTHDDPSMNRVFVETDHTLVIRQVSAFDAAYYFCYDFETEEAKMDILLDVVYKTTLEPFAINLPADISKETRKWLEGCKKIKSNPALRDYECYAEWNTWSRCSVCGKIGERRRIGECRLQKFEKTLLERPEGGSIEAAFPIIGVGCHSVLLDALPNVKKILNQIPNIVLLEKCQVLCDEFATKATRLKAFKQKGSFFTKIKAKIKKKLKAVGQTITAEEQTAIEGDSLAIFCPGISIDIIGTEWKKNEVKLKPERLKQKSGGRIYIDATDAIRIKEVRIPDAGEYICMLDEVEIGLVRLKVKSIYRIFDPSTNFGILTISMVISFFIWVFLIIVKWRNFRLQRKVQRMGQQKYMEEFSDEDSTQMLDSESFQSQESWENG